MSEEDTDNDASYLPDIPHVFQRGSLYAPLPAQSSDAPSQPGHSELYLPTIEGVFEQGIPSESFLSRQYSPRIEGYFEEGLASESVPRTQLSVADQYLPEIEGLFESGYLSDSLSRSLPHSEEGIAGPTGPHRDISQLFQSGSSSGNIEPVTSESPSQLSSSLNLSSVWSSPSRRAPDFLQSPNFDPFAVSTLFESQLFSDISSSSFAPQTTQQSTPLSSRFGLWSPSDSGIQAPDSSFWADNLFRTQEATSEPTGIVAQLTDEIRYQNSSNFVEDLELMAQKGFIIDAQPIGTISKGHFGNAITGQVDISGQTFTFADVGQPFFVKMVECKVGDQMSDMKREMFDIERYILSSLRHPNVITLRYFFSMGQRTQGRYKNNPSISFPSAERQYMILELAELGDLESFLENNQVSEELCLILIRDMYFGESSYSG